jgi:hypothetical protein
MARPHGARRGTLVKNARQSSVWSAKSTRKVFLAIYYFWLSTKVPTERRGDENQKRSHAKTPRSAKSAKKSLLKLLLFFALFALLGVFA